MTEPTSPYRQPLEPMSPKSARRFSSADTFQPDQNSGPEENNLCNAAFIAAAASALALPIAYAFDYMSHLFGSFELMLIGIAMLTIHGGLLYFVYPSIVKRSYMAYVFGVFALTSAIDLLMAIASMSKGTMLSTYIEKGEPYLGSPYGIAANLWDGTAHWILYILMIHGLTSDSPGQYRWYYLFWIGSIVSSLFVLMPGAAVGSYSHSLGFAAILNIPFAALPLYFLKVVSDTPRPLDPSRRGSRVLEFMISIFILLLLFIFAIRFTAANGSNLPFAVEWRKFEPTLTDPSAFFSVTSTVHLYVLGPLFLFLFWSFAFGAPRIHRGLCTDIVIFVAGAMAETQFCYVFASVHPDTLAQYRTESSLFFLLFNLAMIVIPYLIALYVISFQSFYGCLNA